MKLLEMNHIRKKFGDLEVLKDINLSVEEGEVVAVIGLRLRQVHAAALRHLPGDHRQRRRRLRRPLCRPER